MKPINMIKQHPYMATFTGGRMFPEDLDNNYYSIIDICHGLGKAERFGNQADTFISVAQHSVNVSNLVPKEFALHALFHDASEAYTNDMTKPIKITLPDFTAFEDDLSKSIYRQYGLPDEIPEEVDAIDSRIVIDEAFIVFHHVPEWALKNRQNALGIDITPWTPEESMVKWYRRYLELTSPAVSAYYEGNTPAIEQLFRIKRAA